MARTLCTLDVSIPNGLMTETFRRDHPVVPRTIEARGDQTLDQLHRAIFEAYDRWDDCHLSEFHFGTKPFDRHAERYVLPFIYNDTEEYDEQPAAGSTTQTRLARLGLEVGRVFWYCGMTSAITGTTRYASWPSERQTHGRCTLVLSPALEKARLSTRIGMPRRKTMTLTSRANRCSFRGTRSRPVRRVLCDANRSAT